MADVFTDRHQDIMVITMARREANNALSEAFMAQITAAFDQAEADPAVKAVVLTGSDRVFCMGADIEEMLPLTGAEALRWGRLGTELNLKIERFPKPVVAAVNGMALGGGNELAMACHGRIASRRARFGQPECTLGITPGAGATVRLPRLVGPGWAKQLLFTGQMINAQMAQKIHLIDRVTQPESLLEEAMQWAREMAAPPVCEYKEDK